jgi:alkylation response protein AidB-like acyl-CoA dehydrogenase
VETLTEEQSAFAAVVARIIADHRAAAPRPRPGEPEAAFDPALWSALREGEFLAGVAPGLGDPRLLGVLGEEVGRALAPVPLLGSVVLAGVALRLTAPDHPTTTAVLDGSVRAALCLPEPGQPEPVRAHTHPTGIALTGRAGPALGAIHAQRLVVSAVDGDGESALFLVDAGGPGIERVAHTVDLTRDIGTVTFHNAPAERLAGPGATVAAVCTARRWARLVDACEAAGAAQRCLSMSVTHLSVREQFGRPIGTFQALQHLCAVIAVENRAALAAVRRAARAAADDDEAFDLHAAAAHATATRALERAAAGAVQMHGGIGFSWEHDAHLYLRRSRSSRAVLGTAAAQLASVAETLLRAADTERV